jgi:hypothetical protein
MLATTIHKSNTTPHHQSEATTKPTPKGGRYHPRFPIQRDEEVTGLLSQSPIVCLAEDFAALKTRELQRLLCTRTPPTTGERPIQRIAQVTVIPHDAGRLGSRGAP